MLTDYYIQSPNVKIINMDEAAVYSESKESSTIRKAGSITNPASCSGAHIKEMETFVSVASEGIKHFSCEFL